MTTTEPEYLEQLSLSQREKFFEFISRSECLIGDGNFERDDSWEDAQLMATALRAAQILGYEGERLETLFRGEFGISGVTQSAILSAWLGVLDLADVEKRIMVAAGGRN